jgi:perosamine synthetase
MNDGTMPYTEEIKFAKPLIGNEEKEIVAKVLSGDILVHGPVADQFEKDFAELVNSDFAVSVSSCTAGMHLFYFAVGIGPGDEVIVPAQTHVATAHAVELTGAKAVFVDVDEFTGNILPEAIEKAINARTRAIAVVHYLGVPADMKAIMKIARREKLLVVEDCALSLGATIDNVHTGLFGDVGVFSFYPVKHITTGEGGMLITKDKGIHDRIKFLRAFGVDKTHSTRETPGLYDSPELGFNYRMSEIHAAIGVEQIKKLNNFLNIRRRNYKHLCQLLNGNRGFRLMPQLETETIKSAYYCAGVILEGHLASKRSQIVNAMKESGVGTSIYYPQPVPRMTYYRKKYGYDEKNFVNAETISDCMIALPIGPHLSTVSISRVSSVFLSAQESLNEKI